MAFLSQSVWYWNYVWAQGIKTGSGRICCNNARGHVRNRKSNPEAVRLRDGTYFSHKPKCIVPTKPNRLFLMTIISWYFQLQPLNVGILCLKDKFGAWNESHFACCSHCYVTWCSLTTGIVASQCLLSRDAVLVTCYPTPLILACFNAQKTIRPQ